MTEPELFDPGLQPERTELAWRRTSLSIAVGSLVSLRLLPVIGPDGGQLLWLLPGLIGLGFATLVWTGARSRYTLSVVALRQDRPEAVPGAALMLALTVFVIACGVLSMFVVGWLRAW